MRIGSVPYLNARPLVAGLDLAVEDVPSRLAHRFAEGELDVALVPSFEALRRPECPVVPGPAVCSPGPVDSVLLLADRPLDEVRSVLLDRSSLTSAALARILLAERLGEDVEFGTCAPDVDPRRADADGVLLIGDPAMRAPRDGLFVTDLASLWRETTGLPFCFAVWLARDEETAGVASPRLLAARERGLASRPRIARGAAPAMGLPASYLLTYLTERITYDLGPREREGLREYGRRCRGRGLVSGQPGQVSEAGLFEGVA